ncbi:hypothetical protein GQ55_1G383300 [Panicum hallii var. hallii]|uniref:Protein TIFY n=1 Tax=Panicum hallii var. hallii TaxID=1504633 RepID=A0A2T7FBW8_9POAL|nr:hypothetical protein GQ55_1G383300 [Panicum hallii var. hallii]
MELDLLGLGLPPATAAVVGHGGSAGQRHCYGQAAFDEPLRFAAAPKAPSPLRARVRRRPVGTDDDVPAPPANRLKPSSTAPWPAQPPFLKVCIPGAAGDKSPRASQLGSFMGIFPSAPSVQHAIATSTPSPQGASAPAVNGFGRTPPAAAGPIFEGSAAASRSSSDPDHSRAPLTIIYSGSVRAFDSVPMEQAEKILFLTAKEAQAAETPAFQQPVPQSELAAAPPSSAAQVMMLLGLANVKDSLLPKRTASLARFLHKRKQRQAIITPSHKAPFVDMEHPWAFEDGPKSMKENHGEEAVNTELKI